MSLLRHCQFPPHPPITKPLCFLQTIANVQSLIASLLGIAAGILGLESYAGFLFYFVFTLLSAVLFYAFRVAPSSKAAGHGLFDTSRYFRSSLQFWTGGLSKGFAGYILTWTLFYGLIRA
jgi:hypothetical protein